ncbi:MAG: hypothetical protein CVT60_02760 [Actinobacteria bacterium HGW-Actinobacteria-10]|jgi:pyruvate-formate lyase-activating enzyme|nr:MAG: hypothetical protein CVT60_02760 [Actinobacteria bacterium HGW-Actinobacteria-10]
MFFIFGWGNSDKTLGQGCTLECPNCHNVRQWSVVETSQKASLFFIPVAKWAPKYWMVCPICSWSVELLSREHAYRVLESTPQHNDVACNEIGRGLGTGTRL